MVGGDDDGGEEAVEQVVDAVGVGGGEPGGEVVEQGLEVGEGLDELPAVGLGLGAGLGLGVEGGAGLVYIGEFVFGRGKVVEAGFIAFGDALAFAFEVGKGFVQDRAGEGRARLEVGGEAAEGVGELTGDGGHGFVVGEGNVGGAAFYTAEVFESLVEFGAAQGADEQAGEGAAFVAGVAFAPAVEFGEDLEVGLPVP